jgi:L-fucose mutarotase/ribose pyranase (RbsD/FucU family)
MLKSRLLHPQILAALGRAGHSSKILKDEPSIWSDFQQILKASGSNAILKKLERFAFFDAGKDPNVALTVATGEQRLYANLLLQIGVVFPDSALH